MPATSSRPRRAGEHRTSAATRERILEATFAVARKFGYRGTTIARVSAESGLPAGSVYWHFENKDQLMTALIDHSFELWSAEIRLQRPIPGETPREHITRIYLTPGANLQYHAKDFWRLGVMLSIETSVREQSARARFLEIRRQLLDEFASWWDVTLPETTRAKHPGLARQLAGFALGVFDGNAIAGVSDESTENSSRMLGLSLIHLASSDEL